MELAIYRDRRQGKEPIARLDFVQGEFALFKYDDAFLAFARQRGELGISERLPLSDDPYEGQDIAPFFRGLLPEGEVFDQLVHLYQVPRNDYLSLISKLGCETIGALTFVSDSVSGQDFEARYDPLPSTIAHEMAEDPARAATKFVSSTRLSLSGAQSKVAWFLPEGLSPQTASMSDWSAPRGTAPSTHIVKVSRKGEEELAFNELACSLLSAACGIETAEVSLLPEIPGAIAIKRYDRIWTSEGNQAGGDSGLMRLHQEDFCQALGLSPYLKYQPEAVDADYIVYATDLIGATVQNPMADQAEFAKRLIFNYAIGNSDAHLKNYALLYNESWTARRLAPAYDITCIPLSRYSTKMPFDFGAHRDMEDIDAGDITSVALDADVDLTAFDTAVREVVGTFESPSVRGTTKEIETMVARIVDNAAPRILVLKDYLGC